VTGHARTDGWLADFQLRFSELLRPPLDRTTGTLRARLDRYDGRLVDEVTASCNARPGERLAVYNRQYWFRLFGVLHGAFPLTTRLLGHWTLNDYAAQFFLEHAPRHWDIDSAATEFDVFMAARLSSPVTALSPDGKVTIESAAVRDAVAIDAAYRRVFAAPALPPYRPSFADAAQLLRTRLRPSPAAVTIEERWPLVRLRDELVGDFGEAPVLLPPALGEVQNWLLVRHPAGTGRMPLAKREAQLLALLAKHPVGQALAELEAACTDAERADLPAHVQNWLARSVDLGCWCGADQ
jgi:hypothetical protein